MKTREELDALKTEIENLNKKLGELSDEEIAEVAGGWTYYAPNGGDETGKKRPPRADGNS